MTDPILGIRFYRMDDGDGTRFAVTDGDQILITTGDFRRAAPQLRHRPRHPARRRDGSHPQR